MNRDVTLEMVYVGSGLGAVDGYGVEPALIDPSAKIGWNRPDWAGTSMTYWPSYSEMPAEARAAYLSWLADGRRAPGTYIGYVFVFFYGLERRFLIDLSADAAEPEAQQIADEVRRLRSLYAANGSFDNYSAEFLELFVGAGAGAPLVDPAWATQTRRWILPNDLRIGLGRFAAADAPIPADWALAWLRLHPESRLRTPAQRCATEFNELFAIRYRARYGDGMVVTPLKSQVTLQYRPASGGMRSFTKTFDGVLDVTSSTATLRKLGEIADECQSELDAYSRYLGRNADGVGTAEAIGLLPDELAAQATGASPTLSDLRTWASKVTESGPVVVSLDDVVGRWAPGRTAKLAKADAVSLAGLLAKLGVGIEPDVRFGAKTPGPGSLVALFRVDAGSPTAPSPQYAAATLVVHLAAVVAAADGSVTDTERDHLARHLSSALGLDGPEQGRLGAHLVWLTADKVSFTGVKKRIEGLDPGTRADIGQFLVGVAAADGIVTPEEITTLTKLFSLLMLPEADVYSSVHAAGIATGPPTVQPASHDPRHRLPEPPPPSQPAVVRLDQERIAQRLAESAAVSELLADIFADDDEPAAGGSAETSGVTYPPPSGELPDGHPPPPSEPPAGSTSPATPAAPISAVSEGPSVDGLDHAHSTLALTLGTRRTWTRADAQAVAVVCGLPLLDGALDRINEAAMDVCGEPLVDGDETFELNDYAVQELLS